MFDTRARLEVVLAECVNPQERAAVKLALALLGRAAALTVEEWQVFPEGLQVEEGRFVFAGYELPAYPQDELPESDPHAEFVPEAYVRLNLFGAALGLSCRECFPKQRKKAY